MQRRLFIVSNRLPITVDVEKTVKPSSGGLVTAVESYLNSIGKESFSEIFWTGIPECSRPEWEEIAQADTDKSFSYLPVFISPRDYKGYYHGHSNSVLWPLFHYFPSYADYNEENYAAYDKVNRQFAELLLVHLSAGDILWIHDYHLLPLAGLLREEIPSLSIGFFLHIPFPSFELFRLLPKKWQTDMIDGMLGADLIGFHTQEYASHFLQTLLMVKGLENERNMIHYRERLVKADVFPISIDYKKFNASYDLPEVSKHRRLLQEQMEGKKIIFSIDRLDYSKGLNNRLKAYEHFLDLYPQYQERVVFILVIVPSRDSIPKYAEKKKNIDEMISRINSRIGNIRWMPVIYQYNSLEFTEMTALYSACDLALITPLRDGMNLVAKEFVATRRDRQGVLILSEMAGAAKELTDAITINPNDITEMAEKIKAGLEMSAEQQAVYLDNMQYRIANYDVQTWATDYMKALETIKIKQMAYQTKFLDIHAKNRLNEAYGDTGNRLLLLDYDGTLVPFSNKPDLAVPGSDLIELLTDLCKDKDNDVYLISGRNSAWLDKHFGEININLIAEHGARYRYKGMQWVSEIQLNDEWKAQVLTLMDSYVRRCANSFIEEKEFSVVWHYRNADIEQGKLRAFELTGELNEYIYNSKLQVLQGNKVVEVRQKGINKGTFVKRLTNQHKHDYIFAAGDDWTDEDMFRELEGMGQHVFTVKVGSQASYAKYNLHTPHMIVSLLESMRMLSTRKLLTEAP